MPTPLRTPRLSPLLLTGLFVAVGLGAAVNDSAAQSGDNAGSSNLTIENLIGDSVSKPDDSRYRNVGEAIRRFNNRDQLTARVLLESVVEKNPKLPPVGVLMAKMQLLAGNSSAVRPALEQAVQDDSSEDPEPFLLLAEEALAGNRTIEADALFDKAVALIQSYDSNSKRKRLFEIRAYKGAAVIAARRKNWDKAESALRSWIEQDPENASAHSQLGSVLFSLERERDGYEAFVKAKRLNEDLTSPNVAAALMYSRLGKNDKAMAAFDRAVREEPNDEQTLVAYAQALVKAGELSKAASVLKKARSAAPDSYTVWLLSGVAARMEGDPDAAEEHLTRAMSIAPSDRDVLNQLALVLIGSDASEDKRRAAQFAQMNQQLNPNNGDVNTTLAWVLYNTGRNRQATTALQQAVRGGALSPDGSFLLAKLLLARDDKANAKRLIESALKNEQGIFVARAEAERILATL